MSKKIKHPRVYFRKLGRENANGQATDAGRTKIIEIDPRIKGKLLLDTFIHERLHFIFPDLHESRKENPDADGVQEVAEILTDFLWQHGYRRTDG